MSKLQYSVADYGGDYVKMFSARIKLVKGVLYWRGGENGAVSFVESQIGKAVAGNKKENGQQISLLNKQYRRSDIVYALLTGELPDDFFVWHEANNKQGNSPVTDRGRK